MYEFSINDLKRASGIGQRISVRQQDGEKVRGVLKKIGEDHITILEKDTGLARDFPFREIDSIIYEGHGKDKLVNRQEMKAFQRQCERIGEESRMSFGGVFGEEFERYAEGCVSTELAEYLRLEKEGKAARRSAEEYELFYHDFLAERAEHAKRGEEATSRVIHTLLYFRMRKYHKAVASVLERLGTESMEEISLTFICLFVHMKCYMQALFWMERYYFQESTAAFRSDVWWFYLRLAGRYTSYEYVVPMLEKMAEDAPDGAVKSLAYLLMMNNSVGAAVQVLDYDDESLTAAEAAELVERNSSYLQEDTDNNYHRFVRCMKELLENGEISEYDDDEDITGYVYDYVPDKEFGFILGFDLMVYFFRKESIDSDNVSKHIKDNICSMLSVEEEDLVMVTFRRTKESKRSYTAVNIV